MDSPAQSVNLREHPEAFWDLAREEWLPEAERILEPIRRGKAQMVIASGPLRIGKTSLLCGAIETIAKSREYGIACCEAIFLASPDGHQYITSLLQEAYPKETPALSLVVFDEMNSLQATSQTTRMEAVQAGLQFVLDHRLCAIMLNPGNSRYIRAVNSALWLDEAAAAGMAAIELEINKCSISATLIAEALGAWGADPSLINFVTDYRHQAVRTAAIFDEFYQLVVESCDAPSPNLDLLRQLVFSRGEMLLAPRWMEWLQTGAGGSEGDLVKLLLDAGVPVEKIERFYDSVA